MTWPPGLLDIQTVNVPKLESKMGKLLYGATIPTGKISRAGREWKLCPGGNCFNTLTACQVCYSKERLWCSGVRMDEGCR